MNMPIETCYMQVHSGKAFDPDDPEHMKWVYDEVN